MLVSPTEPKPFHSLGVLTMKPEEYGADFLLYGKGLGAVGVQRKEMDDLVSSVRDGRLGRQLTLMKRLDLGVLLIEGRPQWTNDGSLMANGNWTVAQHRGLLWSVQSRGFWIGTTTTIQETIEWLSQFQNWLKKAKHGSLETRPKGRDEFGKEFNGASKDFYLYLMQSFPGVGREVAARLVEKWGVPVAWTITEEQLREVKGIGKGRAKLLASMLPGTNSAVLERSSLSSTTERKKKKSSGMGSSVPTDDWVTLDMEREDTGKGGKSS